MKNNLKLNVLLEAKDNLSRCFVNLSNTLGGSSKKLDDYRKQLDSLSATSSRISQFEKLEGQLGKQSTQLEQERKNLQALSEKLKSTLHPTEALSKKFQLASDRVKKLNVAITTKQKKLKTLSGHLKQAKVDTAQLGKAQEKLAEQQKSAASAVEKQEAALERYHARCRKLQHFSKVTGGVGVATGLLYQGSLHLSNDFLAYERNIGRLKSIAADSYLPPITEAAKRLPMEYSGISKIDFMEAAKNIKSGISFATPEMLSAFTEHAAVTGRATDASATQAAELWPTIFGKFYGNRFTEESERNFIESHQINHPGIETELQDLKSAFATDLSSQFAGALARAIDIYNTSGGAMLQGITNLGGIDRPWQEQIATLGLLQMDHQPSVAATEYNAFMVNALRAHRFFEQKGGERSPVTFVDTQNRALPITEIIDSAVARYGEAPDETDKAELKEALGSDVAVKIFSSLMGKRELLKSSLSDIYEGSNLGFELSQQMAKRRDSNQGDAIDLFGQKLVALRDAFAGSLMPSILSIAEALSPVIEGITNGIETLSTLSPKLTGFAGLSSLAATTLSSVSLMLGAIGVKFAAALKPMNLVKHSISASVSGLSVGLQGIKLAIPYATAALTTLFNAITWFAKTNPVIAIVTTTASVFTLLYKKWQPFQNLVDGALQKASEAFTHIKQWFGTDGDSAAQHTRLSESGNTLSTMEPVKPQTTHQNTYNVEINIDGSTQSATDVARAVKEQLESLKYQEQSDAYSDFYEFGLSR